MGDKDFDMIPSTVEGSQHCQYGLEVYIDNFMGLVIPTSRAQLEHVAMAVMTGIHDVFPANIIDGNNPTLGKKLLNGEGQYSLFKTLLGFDFDGKCKTMWLEDEKGPSSSPLCTVGSGWAITTKKFRSKSLNQWQNCSMFLLAC
jgi:hypothetical protein